MSNTNYFLDQKSVRQTRKWAATLLNWSGNGWWPTDIFIRMLVCFCVTHVVALCIYLYCVLNISIMYVCQCLWTASWLWNTWLFFGEDTVVRKLFCFWMILYSRKVRRISKSFMIHHQVINCLAHWHISTCVRKWCLQHFIQSHMLKVHLGPRDKVKKCDTVINCCIME